MTSSPTKRPPSTVKAQEKKRKAVFKQLLDSPFNIPCRKSVDQRTSNDILDVLCSILSPLSSHRPQSTPTIPRKRKRPNSEIQHPLFIDPPPLVTFLTIGFNPTTQHLESEIRHEQSTTQMRVVFVARGDTNSSQLYVHFPVMASMLPNLRLVSLAKGAEARLCEALGLQRVGVLGVMDGAPGTETLVRMVEEKVHRMEVPWIQDGGVSFVPTRVKWIETLSNSKSAKKETEEHQGDGTEQ